MSPKELTTYRLDEMQKSIERIELNLKEHTTKEEEQRAYRDEKDAERHKEIMSKFEELNKKFAGKWVEKVLVWAGSIAGGIVLSAIVYSVIVK